MSKSWWCRCGPTGSIVDAAASAAGGAPATTPGRGVVGGVRSIWAVRARTWSRKRPG